MTLVASDCVVQLYLTLKESNIFKDPEFSEHSGHYGVSVLPRNKPIRFSVYVVILLLCKRLQWLGTRDPTFQLSLKNPIHYYIRKSTLHFLSPPFLNFCFLYQSLAYL